MWGAEVIVQMGEEEFASGTNSKKQEVGFGEGMGKSLLVGLPVWSWGGA